MLPLLLAVLSPPSLASFVYDITEFEQDNGASTFNDTFSDGLEPPSGPYSGSDYGVLGVYAGDAETGGTLELNSTGAVPEGENRSIGARVQNSTYFFSSGGGGHVLGRFEINAGFSPNSFFGLGIINMAADGSDPAVDDEALISLFTDEFGNKIISWGDESGDQHEDVTASLGSSTQVSLQLVLNGSNQVTALFDWGSDGIIDITKSNFTTLSFYAGDAYTGGFIAGEPMPVPATAVLTLTGLLGVAGWRRRAFTARQRPAIAARPADRPVTPPATGTTPWPAEADELENR
jgi:hypothetical protein